MTAALAALILAVPHAGCHKTFTVRMATRAIDATLAGTREVSASERRRLDRYVRCQRNHAARPYVRSVRRRAYRAWRARRQMMSAVASYYDTHGVGACGLVSDVQDGYRFASLILPCGAVIRICHRSSCEDAEMVDRGPYVGGRLFDLNVNLKDALGCGGICDVTWRP